MTKIQEHEHELVGHWSDKNGKIEKDLTCNRIERLVADCLVPIAHDDSGWHTLYIDTNDDRLWEMVYQDSSWHGGGPPTLRCISLENAKHKYKHKG